MDNKTVNILKRILWYLPMLDVLYNKIKTLTDQEIQVVSDSYALTQILTNIHALVIQLTDEDIAVELAKIGAASLETCRNVASHDYDSLDWARVKRICEKLTSSRSRMILEECLKKLQEHKIGC